MMKPSTESILAAGCGLRIIVDPNEVYPHDPGNGQPVRVDTQDGRHSASWDCATGEGELSCGDYTLTQSQQRWLAAHEDAVDAWRRANGA